MAKAPEVKRSTTKEARVLLDCEVGGKQYKANAYIQADASVIDAAEKAGKVDTHKSAVALADRG